MKVGDIYYQQMEKPDRDYNNAQDAEQEYRNMINMFPDSTLIPRAKQKLRDVQEVLAERETQIGLYYESRENYHCLDRPPADGGGHLSALLQERPGAAGDRRRLRRRSARSADCAEHPGAVRERLRAVYQDKAAAAYAKVITRYPMAPHVEDARDRLVAMNRPVPEPTEAAVAENDAERTSRQPIRFTDNVLGHHQARSDGGGGAHVGEPSLEDPKRTLAPDVTKENIALVYRGLERGQAGSDDCGYSDRSQRATAQRSAVYRAADGRSGRRHRSWSIDCECSEWGRNGCTGWQ